MFHQTVHFTLRSWVCLLFCGVVLLADVKPPMMHYRTSYSGVYPLFAFSLGKSKALILGGYQLKDEGGMAPSTAVEMYDYKGPGKRLAAIPFTVSVATQLSDGSVLACDSNIYGSSSNCAIYRDAKDEWQILDRPRGAGIYPVLTALSNGSALMGGGYFPAGPAGSIYVTEFYLLDPASLRWQRVADAPNDLGFSKGVSMTDGRAFFTGDHTPRLSRSSTPGVIDGARSNRHPISHSARVRFPFPAIRYWY